MVRNVATAPQVTITSTQYAATRVKMTPPSTSDCSRQMASSATCPHPTNRIAAREVWDDEVGDLRKARRDLGRVDRHEDLREHRREQEHEESDARAQFWLILPFGI